jgi:PAS domain S-box-containing protein
MPESQLDAIRRFIREGEERQKKAVAENPKEKTASTDAQATADPMPATPAPDQKKSAEALSPPVQRPAPTVPQSPIAAKEKVPPIQTPPAEADAASGSGNAIAQQVLFLQRRLKIVLESSRDAIISVDASRKWISANRRLHEWLGYDEAEFTKIDFERLFQPEVAAAVLESFPRWLDGSAPLRQLPGNLRGKGAIQIPVLISSHADLNERAEPFAYLMFEDTRPQRELEMRLEDGKTLVSTLLREGSIPVLIMGKDGVIEQANRAARECLNMNPDTAPGLRLCDFIHHADLNEYDDSFDRALRAQLPAEAPCTFAHDNITQFRGRILLTGLPDIQGSITRVIGILDQIIVEPSSAWTAYGQMTPGVLSELSGFLAEHIRVVLEQVRTKTTPDVKRLVKGVNSARFVISRWMESAALIPQIPVPTAFGDLIRQAIDLRNAEFFRLGITPQFENTPAAAEVRSWPPGILHALLHVLQWCVENLREDPGNRRLVIWAQKTDGRLEVSFICRCAEMTKSDGASEAEDDSDESQGFKSLELRLARKIMDSLGATLVLERMSKVHKVIRISLPAETRKSEPQPAGKVGKTYSREK